MTIKKERMMRICGKLFIGLTILPILTVAITIAGFALAHFIPDTFAIALPTNINLIAILWWIAALVLMVRIRAIFRDLRDGGSPFDKKVSDAAYLLAVILAIRLDIFSMFAAALVVLFGLLIGYGRMLQEDVDKTI